MNRWLVLIMLLLTGTACTALASPAPPSVELRGHQFSVELATNDASRAHGLMMRTQLGADHGMLFVFQVDAPRAFWMKDTLIPLDILYFGGNHRLVSVQRDVPPCKADPCPIYPSDGPARYVLELPAGTARAIGVKVGDSLGVNARVDDVQ